MPDPSPPTRSPRDQQSWHACCWQTQDPYPQAAGIPFTVTPHSFRRSCTTELLRSGANMYHVKELLGHESLDTLKHYARLTISDLRETHRRYHPRERGTP